MKTGFTPWELACCGVMGAAGLLLPVIFHIVHLGHVFMPMYLPLVACAFFTRPLPAMLTAIVVPILSGALTGMPPFYPPVAIFMSIELCIMAMVISVISRRWQSMNEWLLLFAVLMFGRILYVGLVYLFSLTIGLPADFMAGVSILKGWPGIVMMMVVVPPLVRAGKKTFLKNMDFVKEVKERETNEGR